MNAPATCSGSPEATYAAISASVTSDGEGDGCLGHRMGLVRVRAGPQAVHRVPGVQHAGVPAHRPPARGGRLGRVGLAEHLAVQLEHRVAPDHDAVEGRVLFGDAGRDIRRLPAREQQHVLGGREGAPFGCLDRRDDGLFVHVRRRGLGLDARLTQQHEPGGRGRGEQDAHGPTLPPGR